MLPVIAIFDIGKTNKKLLLFDRDYNVVLERSAHLPEIKDEDDFPCEDLHCLQAFVTQSLQTALETQLYDVQAINFSAYGASLVYIDEAGKPLAPMCNYLKPYPRQLHDHLFEQWGGQDKFSLQTASPVLGSLNSGLQLYRTKQERPQVFEKTSYALHLPQYLSYLFTKQPVSDITSIGCHTMLWDFEKQDYHSWVKAEGIEKKLAPIAASNRVIGAARAGIGLHDSSAALIPYLAKFREPFLLISTGTWCISLNPFNHEPLTMQELRQDCLCYLNYEGKPVKASRFFGGHLHQQAVEKMAAHFNVSNDFFRSVHYNSALQKRSTAFFADALHDFDSLEECYHHLIQHIVELQRASTQLALGNTPVKRIFVDGGFSSNEVYMNMLAAAFEKIEVYAASMPQATALGAALAIHNSWNRQPVPTQLISLKYYGPNLVNT